MLHLTDATDLKEMIGQLSKGGQQSIEPFIARQPTGASTGVSGWSPDIAGNGSKGTK